MIFACIYSFITFCIWALAFGHLETRQKNTLLRYYVCGSSLVRVWFCSLNLFFSFLIPLHLCRCNWSRHTAAIYWLTRECWYTIDNRQI